MASVSGAISSVFTFASKVFSYVTSGHTQEENHTLSEAEHWQEELSRAIAGGDWAHASYALDALRELRNKAAASQHD